MGQALQTQFSWIEPIQPNHKSLLSEYIQMVSSESVNTVQTQFGSLKKQIQIYCDRIATTLYFDLKLIGSFRVLECYAWILYKNYAPISLGYVEF